MKAVITRIKRAEVSVQGEIISQTGAGLLVLLAINRFDQETAIKKLADKIINLRIFNDNLGKMNLSIKDVGGEIMVVSQFTLYGEIKKGSRPSFIASAQADKALLYYNRFIEYLGQSGLRIASGRFGAFMEVLSVNDGPVTIITDAE